MEERGLAEPAECRGHDPDRRAVIVDPVVENSDLEVKLDELRESRGSCRLDSGR